MTQFVLLIGFEGQTIIPFNPAILVLSMPTSLADLFWRQTELPTWIIFGFNDSEIYISAVGALSRLLMRVSIQDPHPEGSQQVTWTRPSVSEVEGRGQARLASETGVAPGAAVIMTTDPVLHPLFHLFHRGVYSSIPLLRKNVRLSPRSFHQSCFFFCPSLICYTNSLL